MTTTPDPRLLRVQLGIELRRLREEANVSTYEAAETLGCQQPKISKVESGSQGIKPDEVEKLLVHYQVPEEQGDYLREIAARSIKRSRPKKYHRDAVPDWFQRFLALESAATEMRIYEIEVVTGLLQTEDYARATIQAWEPAADPRLVERQVQTRLRRQHILTRDQAPLELHVVLSETALRRVQGDAKTMNMQLEHILTLSERSNIKVQVLPLSVPNRIAVSSSATLMNLRNHGLAWVYLEDFFGASYLSDAEDYTRYSIVFERLSAAALPLEQSQELIDRVREAYV